jgi:hypothetical protein
MAKILVDDFVALLKAGLDEEWPEIPQGPQHPVA